MSLSRHVLRWHTKSKTIDTANPSDPSDSSGEKDVNHPHYPFVHPVTKFQLNISEMRRCACCDVLRGTVSQHSQNIWQRTAIPEERYIPMIISTFTAAQKVAATHVDTVLGDNDERV